MKGRVLGNIISIKCCPVQHEEARNVKCWHSNSLSFTASETNEPLRYYTELAFGGKNEGKYRMYLGNDVVPYPYKL